MKNRTICLLSFVVVGLIVTIIAVSIVLTRRGDNRTQSNNNDNNTGGTTFPVVSPDTLFVGSINLTLPNNDDGNDDGPTIVELARSTPKTLITLVLLAADGRSFQPVGRSYNGKDWEVSAGPYAGIVTFDCDGKDDGSVEMEDGDEGLCSVLLPSIPEQNKGSIYQLSKFNEPAYSDKDIASRFLEQATFGPTLHEIDALMNFRSVGTEDESSFPSSSSPTLTTLAMAKWIKHQQTDVPVASHRAFFRKHLNAQYPIPNPIGPVTTPCMVGSRYRLQSFSVKDFQRVLTIRTLKTSNAGDPARRALLVDGSIRTVVVGDVYTLDENENIELTTWEDGDYTICFVIEVFDDVPIPVLLLDHPEYGNCQLVIFQMPGNSDFQSNPYVNFSEEDIIILNESLQQPVIQDIAPTDATPIDLLQHEGYEPIDQNIIVQTPLEGCPDINANDELSFFVRWSGRIYIHDPRFVLLDNDISTPLEDGGGQIVSSFANPFRPDFSAICANAPRTFLNEDECFVSNSPSVCAYNINEEEDDGRQNLPEVIFEVSHESLRAIFNVTGSGEPGTLYVYAIGNLDITRDPTAIPPCQPGAVSRWIPGPCTGEGPNVALTTDRLMANIIQRFNSENQNPNLVDIFHPPNLDFSCDSGDMDVVGFEVVDLENDNLCWKNGK
jgi:hypothetical protein